MFRLIGGVAAFVAAVVGIAVGVSTLTGGGSKTPVDVIVSPVPVEPQSQRLPTAPPPTPIPAPRSTPAPVPPPVNITVVDDLGPLQAYGLLSEQVVVVIDGTRRATITVDVLHQHSEVLLTLPPASSYNYQLGSVDTFYVNGQTVDCDGSGSGSIRVNNGDRVEIDFMARTCPLRLALVRQPTSSG